MTTRKTTRLSRRHLLRGAGGVALALPFLSAMAPARAAPPRRRYLQVYTPGGTLMNEWRPPLGPGGDSDFSLRGILEPLQPYKQHLLGVGGLGLQVTRDGFGHTHARGMAGLFTGQPTARGEFETDGGRAGHATGPSLDQVLAGHISRDTPLPSVEVALRWPSNHLIHGRLTPNNCLVYQAANLPLPYEVDPQRLWTRLWGGSGGAARRARARSILDSVAGDYAALATRLGAEDRRKLEAHGTKVREVERSLAAPPPAGPGCAPAGLPGPLPDHTRDADLPATGKLVMDMLVLGLSCDLYRVATLQWSDSVCTNTFPWLGLPDGHHDYQHDRGFQPEAIYKIGRFYAEQFAYLVGALRDAQDGEASLLDSTCVLWGSELSHPATHKQDDMPFLLAGRAAGGLRPGRWLEFPGRPHNDLLLSLLHAHGVDAASFGKAAHCTGPLSGLA
jgi:hypothetical protein